MTWDKTGKTPLPFWCTWGLHRWQAHLDPNWREGDGSWLECARPGCPFLRRERRHWGGNL